MMHFTTMATIILGKWMPQTTKPMETMSPIAGPVGEPEKECMTGQDASPVVGKDT
jgi:hypothetical protein